MASLRSGLSMIPWLAVEKAAWKWRGPPSVSLLPFSPFFFPLFPCCFPPHRSFPSLFPGRYVRKGGFLPRPPKGVRISLFRLVVPSLPLLTAFQMIATHNSFFQRRRVSRAAKNFPNPLLPFPPFPPLPTLPFAVVRPPVVLDTAFSHFSAFSAAHGMEEEESGCFPYVYKAVCKHTKKAGQKGGARRRKLHRAKKRGKQKEVLILSS